jgi:DNA-binding CsgD family transcriptional regulator
MINTKTIEGYPNYTITSEGVVTSKNTGREMVAHELHRQYYRVRLFSEGKGCTITIHRLVAKHFVENPNNYPQVNHKDGNRLNNSAHNLEWCTDEQNRQHARNHGLTVHRLTDTQAAIVLYILSKGVRPSAIAKLLNVSPKIIHAIKHRKSYKDVQIHIPCKHTKQRRKQTT